MQKLKKTNFLPLLIAAPSVLLGAAAMQLNQIPVLLWGQNIACLLLAGLTACLAICVKNGAGRKKLPVFPVLLSLLLLAVTFFSPDMDGVHRWISLGSVIRIHASAIVLPVLLLSIWKCICLGALRHGAAAAAIAAVLLLLQPDTSQLTGFAAAAMVMLIPHMRKKYRVAAAVFFSALIALSWTFPDNLAPVAHVEGIVGMLAALGIPWLFCGILSLVMLPAPFLLFPPREQKLPSLCLGLYFSILLLFPLTGRFPVPLMGYGISPIIGYFIPAAWYARSRRSG